MGRRPNPLILEHFERGAKLEDASNRYKHTCKNCGEDFPKGRIDSLTGHLTKKCAALSYAERTKIVLKLHDLENDTLINPFDSADGTTRLEPGRNIQLPYSPSRPQNFNGLNVLAEASRQVGIDQRVRRGKDGEILSDGEDLALDPALEVDDLPNEFLNTSDDGFGSTTNTFSTSGVSATALPSIFAYMPAQLANGPNGLQHLPGLGINNNDRSSSGPPDLSSIAASANETLANVMLPGVASASQLNQAKFLHGMNTFGNGLVLEQDRRQVTWPTLTQGHESEDNETMASPMTQQVKEAASFPTPIAINPNQKSTLFVEETGTAIKTLKPHTRSRFSDQRRKEVQAVRGMGACIRCRMLKKSCSGGDPCTTCEAVESARLWKHPCVRVKWHEQVGIFSSTLHSSLAHHDVGSIKSQINFQPLLGNIEILLLEDENSTIVVNGLQGQPGSSAINPIHGISLQKGHYNKSEEIFLFDIEEKKYLAEKLQQYVEETAAAFYDREISHVMKPTLILASKIAEEQRDNLLQKSLQLWIFTTILTDSNLVLKINVNVDQPSEGGRTSRIPISETSNPYSYSLLSSQFRAAAEYRAAELSKEVMSAIEDRLLKRQRADKFDTFLGAFITLNCFERYCWLFRTWTDEHVRTLVWPMDKKPTEWMKQGEYFADMTNMLLKMRSVPPKTAIKPPSSTLLAADMTVGNTVEWFNQIKVTDRDLERFSDAADYDPKNSRSMDGSLFARVLQAPAVKN